jgi:hypothetical protein
MKLRIKGNTVRLRLTQGEVRALGEAGQVQERTEFPGGTALLYRVRSDDKISEISIGYEGNIIEVRVPAPVAAQWCATEQVTLSATPALAAGTVEVVLEKDFACLAPRPGEDESDHFPHPDAGQRQGRC